MIEEESFLLFTEMGYKDKALAEYYGCSRMTLWRRRTEIGIPKKQYTSINDVDLGDSMSSVLRYLQSDANTGTTDH